MVLGLSLSTYTIIHVIISLIAIAAGFVTVFGMLTGNRMANWTAIFLVTTIVTSVTGFGFPFDHFLPSHAVGAISLVFLAVALFAVYVKHLAGAWRWIYVVSAIVALWFNVFVLIACRVLQAIGGGGFLPSCTGIVAQQFPETRSRMIGLFASIFPIGEAPGRTHPPG
jgi:MFS family permease